ncbi:MAG: outer membrane protein assembly factor [Candidatus Neomarinimicrobiota bacterium]
MIRIFRIVIIVLVFLLQVVPLAGQPENLPIESITIEPLDSLSFSPRQLTGLMKLKGAGLFSRGTPFSRRALKVDVLTITNFYRSHGYLEAQVADSFAITSEKLVKVYLKITEGRQFILEEIALSGNRLLSEEEIIQFLGIKIGKPYNPVVVRDRLRALRRHYQDQGKLTIDILEEITADGGIHLRLTISEGLTYTIGNVMVTGLKSVPEWYVRRELLFQRGDTFKLSKLLLSQQRVFESGLFGAVEIIPTVRAVGPGLADVDVRVRELERRSFDLSAGFRQTQPAVEGGEPNTALSASVQWWHSRAFNTSVRTGITLEGNLIWENLEQPDILVAWDIQTPWTLGLRIPTSVRIYSDFRATPDMVWRNGVELSFLSRRTQRHQLRGALGWVDFRAGQDVLKSVATGGSERSIKIEYFFQGVDNLLEPTQGTIFQIKPSFSGTFVSEVKYYYKVEADIRRYQPFIWRTILAYRLKMGYMETVPVGRGRALESFQLFNLGGSTSLRGWGTPDDFLVFRGVDRDKGGVAKGLVNVELRAPLFWLFGAEVFLDAGALKAIPKRDDTDKGSLKWIWGWDAGAGLLFVTPLGPIRVDAAFPWGELTRKPIIQVGFLHTF